MHDPLKTAIIRSRELGQPDSPQGPLTSTALIYAGPGIGLAEIQASISPPDTGKGKILAVGVKRAEIDQVLATILKIPSLTSQPDYNVCARLVGAERWQSSFALALSIAIFSSYLGRPVPSDFVFLGELDLHRKLRGGTARIVENLRRSIESGEVDADISLVLPPSLDGTRLAQQGVRVIPCADFLAVISAVWNMQSR